VKPSGSGVQTAAPDRSVASTRLAAVLQADEIEGVAAELLQALATATPMAPITDRLPAFELDDAYEVLRVIATTLAAQGWRPVGRKIGFTNRTIWDLYNVEAPMWAHVWDHTVEFVAASATAKI
jgi:2-oxo-3-hexenedioate decarboxylase